MTVKKPQPAAAMIDLALEQKKPKNIIYCRTPEAYLSVCSRFGISRQDLANMAELQALLPQVKINQVNRAVGKSHEICELLVKGQGLFVGVESQAMRQKFSIFPSKHGPLGDVVGRKISQNHIDKIISMITRAKKFDCTPLLIRETDSQAVLQDKVKNMDRHITEGQRKAFLPHEICFFEFAPYHYLAWRDQTAGNTGFTVLGFTLVGMPGGKRHVEVAPHAVSIHSKDGVFQKRVIKAFAPELTRFAFEAARSSPDLSPSMISEAIMIPLSIFNSPSHQPEILRPPEGLMQSRRRMANRDPSKFPFCEYYTLKAPTSLDLENLASRDSVHSFCKEYEGLPTGIRLRYHERGGYKRKFVTRSGVSETKIIEDYWAGNAELGIIRTSKKARQRVIQPPDVPFAPPESS
jgi:hypothetical protein